MNLFQLAQAMQASPNPEQLIRSQLGGNPNFEQVLRMAQANPTPEGMKQVVRNVARFQGIDNAALGQFVARFGEKI